MLAVFSAILPFDGTKSQPWINARRLAVSEMRGKNPNWLPNPEMISLRHNGPKWLGVLVKS